jgi:hypothetical protein
MADRAPDFVVVSPDWTSAPGAVHPRRFPADVYRRLRDDSLRYRLAASFKTPSLLERQRLDYPTVNPPVEIYVPVAVPRGARAVVEGR